MADTPVQPVVTSLRWARWAVLSGALVLGSVLVVVGWANYTSVRDATRELADGEAVLASQQLLRAGRDLGRRPTPADLQAWLEANRDRGVRYAAVGGRGDWIEAGDPSVGTSGVGPRAEPRPRHIGDRVRVVVMPPRPGRPPGPPGMGPPGPPEHRPPPPDGRRPPPAHLPGAIVEIVPVRLNALLARARRDLGINVGVAVALLLAGGFAFRWLRSRELREVARAREKQLARLGEMSAVLAHEIRNPLASLKGHAQLLAESSAEGSREREKSQRIIDEAVRIEKLSTELLELVRTGELDRRETSPASLARESADAAAAGRIKVSEHDAPSSWSLDQHRMRQVLVNLLANAVDASGDGGEVELVVRGGDGRLAYIVRDRGAGIPPGAEERIFEAFHTTRTRGTGLGLAVARRIVELHGGTLVATNHPEGGAVFTATLPPRGDA